MRAWKLILVLRCPINRVVIAIIASCGGAAVCVYESDVPAETAVGMSSRDKLYHPYRLFDVTCSLLVVRYV